LRIFRRHDDLHALERRLRSERPTPSASLMRSLTPRRPRRQFAFAMGLTAVLAVALASVGGVSYAANAVVNVAKVAEKLVTPATHRGIVVVKGLNAGGDQYQPGYGFGDKNHNHAGAPGLNKENPAKTEDVGKKKKVVTKVNVDEQAALYISVLDPDGNRLVLGQAGAKVGGGKLSGKPVKSIHFVVLVPRSIPIELLVPRSLLVPGKTYKIHVIAVDHEGNKSELDFPFTA
jgi:hypothetical protein